MIGVNEGINKEKEKRLLDVLSKAYQLFAEKVPELFKQIIIMIAHNTSPKEKEILLDSIIKTLKKIEETQKEEEKKTHLNDLYKYQVNQIRLLDFLEKLIEQIEKKPSLKNSVESVINNLIDSFKSEIGQIEGDLKK